MRRRWAFLGIAAILLSATGFMVHVSAGSAVEVAPMEAISSGSDGRLALMIPLTVRGTLQPIEVEEERDKVTLSILIQEPFTPFWVATAYTAKLRIKRRMVELTAPLGGRTLVNTEGEPIPVDRLPAGCGIPDRSGSDSNPSPLGTRDLHRTRSVIKIAFHDHSNRKVDHVKVVECSDRVYVSAVPGSKRTSRKVQIVTVRLSSPLGERKVMSMYNIPIPAR
ncbi:hypothetical protein [Actinocorallia aurantiaca]|uniref:Uncharacterized protein n=1 Tax=Actinocorallia aurantiaca TaxID=46204 RepID=A0ABN3U934_9ACTN